MAYIYRYGIKTEKNHKSNDYSLKEYESEINDFLQEMYGVNLKESIVSRSFFEFRVYKMISNNLLRNMGKGLKQLTKGNFPGFVRLKQTLIGYLSQDENTGEGLCIEWLDVSVFDNHIYSQIEESYNPQYENIEENINSFEQRALSDFQRRKEKHMVDVNIVIRQENTEFESDFRSSNYVNIDIVKNSYLDVLESYVGSDILIRDLKPNKDSSKTLIYVEGYLKTVNEEQDYNQLSDLNKRIIYIEDFYDKEKLLIQDNDKVYNNIVLDIKKLSI